jgi:Glycosyl transferase family 2
VNPRTETRAHRDPHRQLQIAADPVVAVIVPVAEQALHLRSLYQECAGSLHAASLKFEFIVVTEPSQHESTEPLRALASEGEPIKLLSIGQRMGDATLLRIGLAKCSAPIVIIIPPNPRIQATALRELVARVQRGADVVVARRWPRNGSWLWRAYDGLLHRAPGTRGKLHDITCGVTVLRREVLRDMPLYGGFCRFLPLFALREGYHVAEMRTPRHARDVDRRLHGPRWHARWLLDIIAIRFLLRFTEKPLRFFGFVGSLFALAGSVILGVVALQRLGGTAIADRPLMLLGALLLVLGVQAIALGLVSEIIVYQSARRRTLYRVRRADSSHEHAADASPTSEPEGL